MYKRHEEALYAHSLTAQFWENEYPDALKSGRVQFQGEKFDSYR
jgi:hypothetical protein